MLEAFYKSTTSMKLYVYIYIGNIFRMYNSRWSLTIIYLVMLKVTSLISDIPKMANYNLFCQLSIFLFPQRPCKK